MEIEALAHSEREPELRAIARTARESAYSPYSGYKCGCALLTASGNIYTGANVENSSYRLTVCAEQVAVTSMAASGDHGPVTAIAVAGEPGDPCVPCGACRQTIVELGPSAVVHFLGPGSEPISWSINDLLPFNFDLGLGAC